MNDITVDQLLSYMKECFKRSHPRGQDRFYLENLYSLCGVMPVSGHTEDQLRLMLAVLFDLGAQSHHLVVSSNVTQFLLEKFEIYVERGEKIPPIFYAVYAIGKKLVHYHKCEVAEYFDMMYQDNRGLPPEVNTHILTGNNLIIAKLANVMSNNRQKNYAGALNVFSMYGRAEQVKIAYKVLDLPWFDEDYMEQEQALFTILRVLKIKPDVDERGCSIPFLQLNEEQMRAKYDKEVDPIEREPIIVQLFRKTNNVKSALGAKLYNRFYRSPGVKLAYMRYLSEKQNRSKQFMKKDEVQESERQKRLKNADLINETCSILGLPTLDLDDYTDLHFLKQLLHKLNLPNDFYLKPFSEKLEKYTSMYRGENAIWFAIKMGFGLRFPEKFMKHLKKVEPDRYYAHKKKLADEKKEIDFLFGRS
jgi:hypothetical protein